MTQNNEDLKSEFPEVDEFEKSQAFGQDANDIESEDRIEKPPPSKFNIFLKKALVWLVVVLIAFAAGFLLNYFLLYQPINAERSALEGQLEETIETVSRLETENSRISTQLDETMEALEAATANALYYQLLVDVNQARVKLFMDDIEGAQESLVTTQDTLEALLPLIESIDADLALSLPRRLDLIVSGIVRDPETGMIDLELFTLDLLALEPLLISD